MPWLYESRLRYRVFKLFVEYTSLHHSNMGWIQRHLHWTNEFWLQFPFFANNLKKTTCLVCLIFKDSVWIFRFMRLILSENYTLIRQRNNSCLQSSLNCLSPCNFKWKLRKEDVNRYVLVIRFNEGALVLRRIQNIMYMILDALCGGTTLKFHYTKLFVTSS
jgi:hypothetical protein